MILPMAGTGGAEGSILAAGERREWERRVKVKRMVGCMFRRWIVRLLLKVVAEGCC
jgi:hypothetical protein